MRASKCVNSSVSLRPPGPECLALAARAWLHQAFLQGLKGQALQRLRLSLCAMCVAETLCPECFNLLRSGAEYDPHAPTDPSPIRRFSDE